MRVHQYNQISYIIKSRKGAKGVRISVHSDTPVVITKSRLVPEIFAHNFLKSKAGWIQEKIEELAKKPKKLLAHYSIKDFKENKQNAYVLVHNKILNFNNFYKFEVKSVTIRNQKTRWGSCSGQGNLNFNYKIIFLPEKLQDYIIVHELCHLKEMNHSKNFWVLVAKQVPDYKDRINKIKVY